MADTLLEEPSAVNFTVSGLTTRRVTVPPSTTLTVTVADPTLPSADALIVAVPALSPPTRPAAFTLAIAGFIEDQANEYPLNAFPFASLAVATSCSVPPARTDALTGLMVTAAIGPVDAVVVTVTWADPVLPPALAVTVAVPPATPVTRPPDEMEATAGFDDAHAIVCPAMGFPSASNAVALSCAVADTAIDAVEGVTDTVATVDDETVTTTVSSTPPVIARIRASPTALPVKTPLETVATEVFIDNHSTGAAGIGLPDLSYAVAVNVVVPPTVTTGFCGEMTIEAALGVSSFRGFWPLAGPFTSLGDF